MENKRKNRWILILVLALAISVALYAAGALIGAASAETAKETASVAALCVLCTILTLLAANIIASMLYVKAKNKMNAEERTRYLNYRKESAKANLIKSVRKIRRIRISIQIYTVFILLLSAAYPFLCGFVGQSGTTIISVYLFYGFLQRIHRTDKADFEGYSDKKDFPRIYAIAEKAAKEVGTPGEIKIIFTFDCNAGIAKIGKVNSLQIGAVLLDVLTEDELYAILIHEFAHLTKKCYPHNKEVSLFDYISSAGSETFAQYTNLLFKFPQILFAWEFSVYRAVASESIESVADSAVLEHGCPQDAVNAMAKINYADFFSYEIGDFIPENYYEPEECRPDKVSRYVRAFRKAIPQRKDAWDSILANEIEPRSASHPIFRNRMAALGISSYETLLPENNDEYRQECARVLEKADKEDHDYAKEGYEAERKENYLEPLAMVEKWKESGTNPPAEEARPLIDALARLGMRAENEALCDSIIAETENKFALPHAYMTKGKIMLLRYDKGGIDYMYKAMDINSNYIDWGLDEIGAFCCRMGLEKELLEYREKAVEYAQSQMDKYDETGTLTARDNILPSDMPADLLDEIVSFMKNADEKEQLRAVYHVKKQISEDFGTDVFMLVFRNDYDNDACGELYDKIFNFLDTHPTDRQFSLFVYDKSFDAALKKAKNYIVFER